MAKAAPEPHKAGPVPPEPDAPWHEAQFAEYTDCPDAATDWKVAPPEVVVVVPVGVVTAVEVIDVVLVDVVEVEVTVEVVVVEAGVVVEEVDVTVLAFVTGVEVVIVVGEVVFEEVQEPINITSMTVITAIIDIFFILFSISQVLHIFC